MFQREIPLFCQYADFYVTIRAGLSLWEDPSSMPNPEGGRGAVLYAAV